MFIFSHFCHLATPSVPPTFNLTKLSVFRHTSLFFHTHPESPDLNQDSPPFSTAPIHIHRFFDRVTSPLHRF